MNRPVSRRNARRIVRGARRAAWYDSPWRIVGAALSIAVTIALLAVVAALFVVPKVLGGASLTVLTGSMEPVFMPGDVVVVKGVDQDDVCSSVGIGDIVTYYPEPGNPDLITHRVVAKTIGTFDDGTDCRLITQGDNNDAVDEPVSPAQVRGLFMYGIPKLGWARQWIQTNPQTMMVAVGVIVVAYLLWTSLRPAKTRVVAYGGQQGGIPAMQPAQPSPTPVPEPFGEVELQLRLRELAVREREVAVREAELGFFGINDPTADPHPLAGPQPTAGADPLRPAAPPTDPVPIHTRAVVAPAATPEQS